MGIKPPEVESDNLKWLESSRPITKIFIGYNGLDVEQQFAVHSCGHLAVTVLAKNKGTSIAQVYLVGTSNKHGKLYYKHLEKRSEITWLKGNRNSVFKALCDYNPLEDIIKLDLVDYVISDLGFAKTKTFLDTYNRLKSTS